jgi:small GTP-binding protein
VTRVTLTTANTPGAVAMIQLHGDAVVGTLERLTGRVNWNDRRAYLVNFANIDEGLGVLVNNHTAQLMPHGGPRVVQRLLQHLTAELGCAYDATPDPREIYPEADSPIEADMLDAIAKATSPAAIDLLSQQAYLWRGLLQQAGGVSRESRKQIVERSIILNHLLNPPTVVVAGPANVGKSTLTNALMGKAMSIVADLPGTTRDWVGGLVELSASNDAQQAIAVNWLDTPGLRDSDDTVEQRAIQLAKQQIEQADVLITMRDRDQPWPDAKALPRKPDLWVINKVDDAQKPDDHAGLSSASPLAISAIKEIHLDRLQSIVIGRLGLDDLLSEPWAFSDALVSLFADSDYNALSRYLQGLDS